MLFHLSFLYSYNFENLYEKFKKCCKECLLSNPLVSLDQNGTYLMEFDIPKLINISGKEVYNDLVDIYNIPYNFKEIIYDFRLFLKSCHYFQQNGSGNIFDTLKISLSKMNPFEALESEFMSYMLQNITQIPSTGYNYLQRTTETLLESLKDIEREKLDVMKYAKDNFEFFTSNYKARNVSGEVKFKLTEEDTILLKNLIHTIENLEIFERLLKKIETGIKSKTTFDARIGLCESFIDLAYQIEVSYQEIKYTGNKYLQFLEIESEIKFEEYLALQARLNARCDLLKQYFVKLGHSVPVKISDAFDSNLELNISGFIKKAEQLISNFVKLEKELDKIAFNTSNLSIFQRIRFFLMDKYKVNCIKLHDLEQKFSLIKSELQCLLNTNDKLKITLEEISKQSDLSSKQDILLKYHSLITELISSDLIEMNGSNLKVKDKIKFEEKIKGYSIESVDILSKMQRMRWIYLIVTFSIFLVFLCLGLAFIYYLCKK